MISNKVIRATLRKQNDCQSFVTGSFKSQDLDGEPNLRLYKFDRCLSENQHSRKLLGEARTFLRAWLVHSRIQDDSDESCKGTGPFKFAFLFGSSQTQKSEFVNLMNKDSMLQEFLRDLVEPVQFLTISMFFQDQEFILNNRKFDSSKQSQREIGMEIREALRDKGRLV